jgi:hypothetical protein
MNHMKKKLLIAITPMVILFAGPWVVPRAVSLTAINRHDSEINIKTGQARYWRHLWYIKISEWVEDTVLSKVLNGESVEVADIAPWRTVNTSSPGSHYFLHPRFHGALFQAHEIELLFEMLEPNAERKKQIVRELLTLWQTHGDYFEASRYTATLSEETGKILDQRYPGFFPGAECSGRKRNSREHAMSDPASDFYHIRQQLLLINPYEMFSC